jgi:PTH1 family peptidyl-tRNA hydrolase
MPIRAIIGLGNPGPQYEATRHNVGFWLVDALAGQQACSWQREEKFQAEVTKPASGPAAGCWLVKPQTFMNRSGLTTAALAQFYRLAPEELLVVHDELDIAPGEIRLKQGGGHGGHNGVRDIAASLGSPDFWRLRLGIGHPRTLNLRQEVADFVLHRPSVDETIEIERALDRCLKEISSLISGDFAAAQRVLHAPNP